MMEVGEVTVVAQEDVRQDLRAMFRGAIRVSLEMFLEAELESLVGAEWYARVGGRHSLIAAGTFQGLNLETAA